MLNASIKMKINLSCFKAMLAGSLFIAVCACQDKTPISPSPKAEENEAKDKKAVDELIAELKKKHPEAEFGESKSGLQYFVIKEGKGDKAGKGRDIKAHYTGRFLDGKKFDSSRDRGEPLAFKVGVGQVIKGWDVALSDMNKGEQRILIIPPNLAYGERGAGGVIPPNATLVFDVELVDF